MKITTVEQKHKLRLKQRYVAKYMKEKPSEVGFKLIAVDYQIEYNIGECKFVKDETDQN